MNFKIQLYTITALITHKTIIWSLKSIANTSEV